MGDETDSDRPNSIDGQQGDGESTPDTTAVVGSKDENNADSLAERTESADADSSSDKAVSETKAYADSGNEEEVAEYAPVEEEENKESNDEDEPVVDEHDEHEEIKEEKSEEAKESGLPEVSDDSDHEGSTNKSKGLRRVVMSSDDEEDDVGESQQKGSDVDAKPDDGEEEVAVGELMTNIFGEESDEEGFDDSGHHEAEASGGGDGESPRGPRGLDDDEDDGRVWDFDVMLSEKKAERRKIRRRRKDGSVDVSGDMDDQIKLMIDAMKAAAKDDRHCNMERKPALHKRKMLKMVKALLIKHDCMEAIIDNGMMNAVSEWLAPLPDKSLPALEIRAELLRILQGYGRLEPGTLKQSGLGRAVMLLFKHPRETPENKRLAQNLLREWARPIFQLETDFSTMTKDERVQRDYAQQPEAKKRRLSSADSPEKDKESEPRPGDKGFIIRARVPRPSQKDYVVRPKSTVEGQFHGASKSRQNSRFDKAQREFRERNKQSKNMRAMKVSIEGRKMDI